MGSVIQGKVVIAGQVEGPALVGVQPLSFWGGYDHQTGEITDRRHPLSGHLAGGRILIIPYSRGSSTTTAVLLEAMRNGTAPAAILTSTTDAFFALASIVAKEIYGQHIPLLTVTADDFSTFQTDQWIRIEADGRILIDEGEKPVEKTA